MRINFFKLRFSKCILNLLFLYFVIFLNICICNYYVVVISILFNYKCSVWGWEIDVGVRFWCLKKIMYY